MKLCDNYCWAEKSCSKWHQFRVCHMLKGQVEFYSCCRTTWHHFINPGTGALTFTAFGEFLMRRHELRSSNGLQSLNEWNQWSWCKRRLRVVIIFRIIHRIIRTPFFKNLSGTRNALTCCEFVFQYLPYVIEFSCLVYQSLRCRRRAPPWSSAFTITVFNLDKLVADYFPCRDRSR